MTATNVIERINEARKIVAETDFKKSGKVTGGQSYNFIPIATILDAVRKAHAKAGVTVIFGAPEYDDAQFEQRYSFVKKGQYGETTWHAAVGHIHATIYGSSVEDCIEMDIPFEAQDNSDKLTNKIITNAERCLYRVLYAIDEGDATDPEAFNYEMPAEVATKTTPKKRASKTADPFFSTPEDKNVELAETHRKAILEYSKAHVSELPDILRDYLKQYGIIPLWPVGICTRVYNEMVTAGFIEGAVE